MTINQYNIKKRLKLYYTQSTDDLEKYLTHKEPNVRKATLLSDPRVTPDHILRGLQDPDPRVRKAAILSSKCTGDMAKNVLYNKEEKPYILHAALSKIHGNHNNYDERQANMSYASNNYKDINDHAYYMATGKNVPPGPCSEPKLLKDAINKHIKHIDASISRKMPVNIQVYRGIKDSLGKRLLESPVGKIHIQHSYTSTSIDPKVAHSFAGRKDGHSHVIVGILKKGHNYTIPDTSNSLFESEVLLPRNQRYKKINSINKDGTIYHHVEFLPPEK